jgi:hypothetical protein
MAFLDIKGEQFKTDHNRDIKLNFIWVNKGHADLIQINFPISWAHVKTPSMDHSPISQNFELNKSRQKIHHSLKEHHKISNIPKFRCKML